MPPIPLPVSLNDLRDFARHAYAKGQLVEAAEAQSAVLTMAGAGGAQIADDFLFAGLVHNAAGRIDDGIQVLQDGLSHYPGNASLHENLAVLLLAALDIPGSIQAAHSALVLGSDSPNVYDCLCDAYQRIGRPEQAI
jgi:tetratricopeptide (TPR) repeat protein